MLAQADLWSGLQASMRYFGDEAMSRLLEEMRDAYHAMQTKSLESDTELRAVVTRLDARYQETAPMTLKRIGEYIRSHPGEFVRIEE